MDTRARVEEAADPIAVDVNARRGRLALVLPPGPSRIDVATVQVRAEKIGFVAAEAGEEIGPSAGKIHIVFGEPLTRIVREATIKGDHHPIGVPVLDARSAK